MRQSKLFLATACISLIVWPAHAANDPGRPGIAVAKGDCSRLILGADDYSADCDGQVASVTLDDGSVTFIFSVGGEHIGFRGDGHQVNAGPEGILKLPVSFIAVGEGASKGALDAEGSCWFTDPYAGAAIIWCVANTKGGPFVATFKTDGEPPAEQN